MAYPPRLPLTQSVKRRNQYDTLPTGPGGAGSSLSGGLSPNTGVTGGMAPGAGLPPAPAPGEGMTKPASAPAYGGEYGEAVVPQMGPGGSQPGTPPVGLQAPVGAADLAPIPSADSVGGGTGGAIPEKAATPALGGPRPDRRMMKQQLLQLLASRMGGPQRF